MDDRRVDGEQTLLVNELNYRHRLSEVVWWELHVIQLSALLRDK